MDDVCKAVGVMLVVRGMLVVLVVHMVGAVVVVVVVGMEAGLVPLSLPVLRW